MGFDLEQILKDNTKEGIIDIQKVKQLIDNDYVNPIVAKNKPNIEKLKAEARDSAVNDFIKEQSIKDVINIDQFSAYVKTLNSTSTELTEKNIRYKTERDDLKTKYEESSKSNIELNSNITSLERKGKIIDSGFNSKYTKHVLSEIDSRLTEDNTIEDVITEIKDEYPEWQGTLKAKKGNDLLKNDTIETDQAAIMAKAWGIK